MTLAEAARELRRLAFETRDVAARVDGTDEVRWAIARDLRATAFSLDRIADVADRAAERETPEQGHAEAMAGAGWTEPEMREAFGR